jgi:protein TonB
MKSFLLSVFLFLGFNFPAQETPKTTIENIKDSIKIDYDAVIKYVDEDAEYPGGLAAMMKFIQGNVVYPDGILVISPDMGRIRVKFIVEKNGTLSQIEVLNENPEFRKLYQELFAKMPPWKPAKLDGIIVRQQFFLPIIICFN